MDNTVTPQIKSIYNNGFTLIELSIVLVIIGLIVGGILVGQDLIKAAAIRAQISQIDKYNSAVNTFYGKYGFLPGDIPDPTASRFGFVARGTLVGQGDGNGVIEGYGFGGGFGGSNMGYGENQTFWADLSTAGYIDGSFTLASSTSFPPVSPVTLASTPSLYAYLPAAKIGNGNFVLVYSGGPCGSCSTATGNSNGINYFRVQQITAIVPGVSSNSMPVSSAYAIDKKMDDGLPESGQVLAMVAAGWIGGDGGPGDTTTAITPSATTCYDNGGNATVTRTYSLGTLANGGTGLNCALSFQMISP